MLDGTVMLADADKIKMLAAHRRAGSTADLAGQVRQIFYAGHTRGCVCGQYRRPMQVEVNGVNISLYHGGWLVWNELVDGGALEKSDFKGQSSGRQAGYGIKCFEELPPEYEKLTLKEAQGKTNGAKTGRPRTGLITPIQSTI